MGMMLKPIFNSCSGWGEGDLHQKNDDLTKFKVIIDVFFDWKDIVHHEICSTRSDIKQTVVPGNFSAFEECCVQEEA